MDPSEVANLIAIAMLVLTNAFFVAAEFAMVALRRTRLQQLASAGDEGASAALEVVQHLDTYIAACQLGVTMASLALGWIGEPALADVLNAPLEQALGPYAPRGGPCSRGGKCFWPDHRISDRAG